MDTLQQMGLPVLGIVAAAAVTFYAVSFLELSEKSFQDMDCKYGNDDSELSKSSRKQNARRKAEKQSKR